MLCKGTGIDLGICERGDKPRGFGKGRGKEERREETGRKRRGRERRRGEGRWTLPTWGQKGNGMARPGGGNADWKSWGSRAASVAQSSK